jgi:hypothetical protein
MELQAQKKGVCARIYFFILTGDFFALAFPCRDIVLSLESRLVMNYKAPFASKRSKTAGHQKNNKEGW